MLRDCVAALQAVAVDLQLRADDDAVALLDVGGQQLPVRDLKPQEILEHVLAHLEEVEGQLKAVSSTRSRGAVRTAEGVF